jgi:hypothetical protein
MMESVSKIPRKIDLEEKWVSAPFQLVFGCIPKKIDRYVGYSC